MKNQNIRTKKAEVQSKVVIYTMAGIIAVILLIAAFKAIIDFRQRQNEILVKQFEEDLTEATATIDFGSVEEHNLQLPSDVTEVCFVDLSKREEVLKSPLLRRIPIMKNIIESGIQKNVFLIAGTEVKDSMYGGDICADHYPYYVCLEASGSKLNIFLEGKGRCALLLADLMACAELESPVSEDISLKTIDAELKIPAGTTITPPGKTKICIEPVPPPPPFDKDPDGLITEVYSLTPQGTGLSSSFIMRYYPELLPPGLKQENIKMKYYESDVWTKLQNTDLDTAKKRITAPITSLKQHAVFGPEAPAAVIKIIESDGPPIQHYQQPYFFPFDEEIKFDGSDSYDEDGDGVISAYEWDFGNNKTSIEIQPRHTYTDIGYYTVELTITDSDDNQGTSTADISIMNTNNIKDTSKYENTIFLISKSDTWRNVLQLVPLTMWTGNNEAGSYGRVEKPYLAYEGTISSGELTKIMSKYSATKAAFFSTVPPELSGLDYVTRITSTNYFTYWSGYEDVVLVEYNNKDAALMSALFASFMNTPIIFISNTNKAAYVNYIFNKNVYIIGNLDADTDAYVRDKAATVTTYTLSTISSPPKNPYSEIYIDVIPSAGIS